MRRAITAGVLVAGLVWLPAEAGANGGAYLELDQTYYVRGAEGEAELYVAIPEKHQDLLERGPFYGYLLPIRDRLVEGRPLPMSAVYVGTFTVEEGKRGIFELTLAFEAPTVPTGEYQLRMCNDPCTVAGFGETVTGYATIAATATEVQLMRQERSLRGDIYHLKRELKRSEKVLAEVRVSLDAAEEDRVTLANEASQLRADLESLQAKPESPAPREPIVDGWAAVVLALALGVAGGLLARRLLGPAARPAPA